MLRIDIVQNNRYYKTDNAGNAMKKYVEYKN